MRPGGDVVCRQGVSLFRISKSPETYVLRLGRNGFLSNECSIALCDGARTPDVQDEANGTKVLYDVFPVETGLQEGVHCYKLAKPVRDDTGVALVRFSMGGQVPEKCRAEVWPSGGTPFPVGLASCAMDRRPWPRQAVDGVWVVNIGDSFSYESEQMAGKLILTENGMEPI